jgi:allantoicase
MGDSNLIADNSEHTDLLRRYINVADARLGAAALYATDEFFAAKERMLQPTEPEWRAGVHDDNGKWMDGWESRRRRDQGHDYETGRAEHAGGAGDRHAPFYRQFSALCLGAGLPDRWHT